MEIVFVSAELTPLAKTGGLGDVCFELPKALANLGHSVSVFIPKYRCVEKQKVSSFSVLDEFFVPVGADSAPCGVECIEFASNIKFYLIKNRSFFDRNGLYGTEDGDYSDNHRRFIFFNRAVIEAIRRIGVQPDVIHCHDWHAALVPVYLKSLYKYDLFFEKTKTVFTIHNLAFQGIFSGDTFFLTGLNRREFDFDGLEYFGDMNFMKGAILYSDVVTIVSETYAKEIQTEELGCGLFPVLKYRSKDLVGIINGIDEDVWNPATDKSIQQKFSINELELRNYNKKALQKKCGFKEDEKIPLLGLVGRVAEQKGFDLLIKIMPKLLKTGAQIVILGQGDRVIEKNLEFFSAKNQKNLKLFFCFDDTLARCIYAGSDIFLMPSRFEPCGLGQLISLRYGSIPVVRKTGGLADTIQPVKNNNGNGFCFNEYSDVAFLKAVNEALNVYADKERWKQIILNAMKQDFSWHAAALKYAELYKRVEKNKGVIS